MRVAVHKRTRRNGVVVACLGFLGLLLGAHATAGEAIEVSGRVVDEAGRPVAGALLTTGYPDNIRGPLPKARRADVAVTDAEGRFALSGPAIHRKPRVFVEGPPDARPRWFGRTLEDVRTGTTDLVVVLRRGHEVSGAVTGVDAAALRGARLTAYVDHRRRVTFTFDGSTTRFHLSPLPEDLVELRLKPEPRGALIGPGAGPLRVEAPASKVHIDLAQAHVLRGRVTGHPDRKRVTVTYYDAWGRHHNPAGALPHDSFEIRGVPAGPGQLHAGSTYGDHAALLDDVDPTQGPYELKLARKLRIRGRIEGLPAEVKIGGVCARRGRFSYRSGLERDGTFETQPLPLGRYSLEFDVGDPVGGIVPTLKGVGAGAGDVVARWDPDP